MTEEDHLTSTKDTKFQSGWKGGPGRPKKLKTQVKDFVKKYPQAVEELMLVIYEMGIEGDLEACKYFIDRVKGKPKAILGIDEDDKELLAASTMIEFFKLQDAHRKGSQKLLEEGSQDATEQRGSQSLHEEAETA